MKDLITNTHTHTHGENYNENRIFNQTNITHLEVNTPALSFTSDNPHFPF